MSWKFFVLGRDKTPLPNCGSCRAAGAEHDPECCTHLTCHGFYAATDDRERLEQMARLHPEGEWAVRTGAASGIIVLDAEGDGSPSGVEVLDGWESWVGGWPLPTTNRIALTPSGGVHRYYTYVTGVRSRNRVLPGVDVKSEGGYVVIPSTRSDTRRCWALEGRPGDPDERFSEWLRTTRGRGGGGGSVVGHPAGYDYDEFVKTGCPGGVRDEFFNEMCFRLRKAGVSRQVATIEIRRHWGRAAQPPDATWWMPWHHVEYKIERVWRTVEPDRVDESLAAWARTLGAEPGTQRRAGRVTLAAGEP